MKRLDLSTQRDRERVALAVAVVVSLSILTWTVGIFATLPMVAIVAVWAVTARWVSRGKPTSRMRQLVTPTGVGMGSIVLIDGQRFRLADPDSHDTGVAKS